MWFTFVQVCSYALVIIFMIKCGDKINGDLASCFDIGFIVTTILFLIIYIGIFIKSKKNYGYINLENKICKKGNKIVKYNAVKINQTILQRITGLVNIKFMDQKGNSIILRDVSKRIRWYL